MRALHTKNLVVTQRHCCRTLNSGKSHSPIKPYMQGQLICSLTPLQGMVEVYMKLRGHGHTLKLRRCGTVQEGQATTLRRLAKQECHEHKEPVEQESLLHARVQACACQPGLHRKHIHTSTLHPKQMLCPLYSQSASRLGFLTYYMLCNAVGIIAQGRQS